MNIDNMRALIEHLKGVPDADFKMTSHHHCIRRSEMPICGYTQEDVDQAQCDVGTPLANLAFAFGEFWNRDDAPEEIEELFETIRGQYEDRAYYEAGSGWDCLRTLPNGMSLNDLGESILHLLDFGGDRDEDITGQAEARTIIQEVLSNA